MPYIKKEERIQYEKEIENLVNMVKILPDKDKEGHLNYFITKVLNELYDNTSSSYCDYNKAIGLLECIKLEFYRRSVVAYENRKMSLNGDV
jgi:hypothetical protein